MKFRDSLRRRALQAPAAAAAIAIVAIAAACGSSEPVPSCLSTGLPAGYEFRPPPGFPPSFPYIFNGRFAVEGAPGPRGVPVFARLGDQISPINETDVDGEYGQIILAPAKDSEVGRDVVFYIGEPEGENVRANEKCRFEHPVGAPTNITFDISFDRLP